MRVSPLRRRGLAATRFPSAFVGGLIEARGQLLAEVVAEALVFPPANADDFIEVSSHVAIENACSDSTWPLGQLRAAFSDHAAFGVIPG